MKKITILVLVFLLLFVAPVFAQVSQVTGGASWVGTPSGGSAQDTWRKNCATLSPSADAENPLTLYPGVTCSVLDVDALLHIFNGTSYDRARTASGGAITTGLLATGGYTSTGQAIPTLSTPTDQGPERVPLHGIGILDEAGADTVDAWRRADDYNGQAAVSPPGVQAIFSNGATFDVQRGISATILTATTSQGIPPQVPLSTWFVTHTPAAATQATASKAAGGGTVRHVATTITACSAQAGTAQTPIAINLRDGASGAGTIIRSWKISTVIQDSKCVDLSGLAMIGTANTAMTLEFAGAGVAASEQTVTLTGFSVP